MVKLYRLFMLFTYYIDNIVWLSQVSEQVVENVKNWSMLVACHSPCAFVRLTYSAIVSMYIPGTCTNIKNRLLFECATHPKKKKLSHKSLYMDFNTNP